LQNEKATIKVESFGRLLKITRQAIINDDLDVFGRIPRMFAQGAANMQAEMFWAMITGNAKTPDGTTLFHATHGNLAGAGAAPSEATLNAARVAMARQKSPAGEVLNILPKYIICPPELSMTIKKLMTGITANNTSDVNVFQNAFNIIEEVRLTDSKAWYMATDPNEVEGLLFAYLDGEEGIYTESQTNFNTDDLETKARLEFGVAAWGYRGWYKNAGQ
jgi:hypothetical protein